MALNIKNPLHSCGNSCTGGALVTDKHYENIIIIARKAKNRKGAST